MNLIIDIGNSFFKVALFSDNQLIEKHTFDSKNKFQNAITSLNYNKAIASSVGPFDLSELRIDNLLIFKT